MLDITTRLKFCVSQFIFLSSGLDFELFSYLLLLKVLIPHYYELTGCAAIWNLGEKNNKVKHEHLTVKVRVEKYM